MHWRARRQLVVALAGLSLLAAGCGGDSDAAPAGAKPPGGDKVLTIEDFAFGPDPLVVPPGTVVTVVNRDDAAHTATADDGSFGTAELAEGQREDIELPRSGEVAYHCAIHDYMRGVIRVAG